MGRRKGWLSKVKKALSSEHKEDGDDDHERSLHTQKMTYKDDGENEPDMLVTRTVDEYTIFDVPWSILEEPYVPPVTEQAAKLRNIEWEEKEHDADRLQDLTNFDKNSKEEAAAIMIQTVFRAYKVKKDLRVARLKTLMQGSSVKRQTVVALQCMQTLSRVQSQIRARRIRMSEENQALQRQIQIKHEKDMEKMKLSVGDDWNDSTKSKEKLEASLRYRQEAAMRRERALAYAHSQQQKWRNGLRAPNPTFMDPINPHWGWNWLERWMAARPWESSTAGENGVLTSPLSVDEISKAYYAHRARHPDSIKPLPVPQRSSRLSTQRLSPSMTTTTTTRPGSFNEDSRSVQSVQFKKQRRHSVASTSMSHNARLSNTYSASARTVTSAEAHKARLLKSSSARSDKGSSEISTLGSGSTKKRLSYSPSYPIPSAARRHSGPSKA